MRLLTLAAMALVAAPSVARSAPAEKVTTAMQLHALFDEQWEVWMEDSPTWASSLGDRRYNDRWPDVSLAAVARRDERNRAMLGRLDALDAASLSDADRLNLALFRRRIADDVEETKLKLYLMPIDMRNGIQLENETAESLRFETVKDYEDWIARLRAIGPYIDGTASLLAEGIRTGMVQPRVIMERVPEQIENHVVEDPSKSPFYDEFESFPETIPDSEHARLRTEAREAIRDHVVPAYRRLHEFFETKYMPATRTTIGASELPGGKDIYAYRVAQMTTTNMTAKEIHELGLSEVARIRGEMDRIIAEVKFKGTFEEFLTFLRTDPQFYVTTSEELLRRYRDVAKRIDPEMVRLFHRLPRMPYGVKPIPAESAPDTTTAYYNGPAADGSRAGTYYVNLYKPEARPLYEMMALSLHEAVPGHHTQISIAQELDELPKFRRFSGYTAFVEGWGLYAEHLGDELGLYDDPYSKFGQLTYEMWRAVRLVVDTGMHAFGWERQRAIDFFKANAAKSEHDIVNEIDRYIGWPGQALAYKVGELTFKRLRREAALAMGDRFDVREFHDVALGAGAIPLDDLENRIHAWMREPSAAPSAGTPGRPAETKRPLGR